MEVWYYYGACVEGVEFAVSAWDLELFGAVFDGEDVGDVIAGFFGAVDGDFECHRCLLFLLVQFL